VMSISVERSKIRSGLGKPLSHSFSLLVDYIAGSDGKGTMSHTNMDPRSLLRSVIAIVPAE